MTIRNPILATDSYKFSHFMQYPAGAQFVTSYIEARGTKIPGVKEVVSFGIQPFVQDFLMKKITRKNIDEAEAFCAAHGVPFNREGWEIIVNEHGGYMPLKLDAVPDGTVVPLGNATVQLTNLDERLPWLTSYVETVLLQYYWYMSTVATLSREIKKVIKHYLDMTSDDPEAELPFKLHDFGYRGVAPGAADFGGMAHLVNFMGTDTVAGIEAAMDYYGAGVCGFSISASEHSTMTSWGRENEYAAYKNMVAKYAKKGAIFACVIDSYDTDAAISMWAHRIDPETNLTLLEQVKEAGATVVLRPDSGDARQMPIHVIEQLMHYVGFEINEKGYRVLPSHVRVIQGDGIDIDDVNAILGQMLYLKLSASNIAFGMGGGLLQKVNRDTFKFAMKANEIVINGETIPVQKKPTTDATKVSKAGAQMLLRNRKTGEFKTVPRANSNQLRTDGWYNAMQTVYRAHRGATAVIHQSFEEVRKNAEVL